MPLIHISFIAGTFWYRIKRNLSLPCVTALSRTICSQPMFPEEIPTTIQTGNMIGSSLPIVTWQKRCYEFRVSIRLSGHQMTPAKKKKTINWKLWVNQQARQPCWNRTLKQSQNALLTPPSTTSHDGLPVCESLRDSGLKRKASENRWQKMIDKKWEGGGVCWRMRLLLSWP